MRDPFQHLQDCEAIQARLNHGEELSDEEMTAVMHQGTLLIQEQLEGWWLSYCLGVMTTAALRQELDELYIPAAAELQKIKNQSASGAADIVAMAEQQLEIIRRFRSRLDEKSV